MRYIRKRKIWKREFGKMSFKNMPCATKTPFFKNEKMLKEKTLYFE